MSEPLKTYAGTLRPRITILGLEEAKVEWINTEGVVVWTETSKPRQGYSFVSQITCVGEFATSPGYFVDEDGKRHFVMKCDPGRLGVPFGNVEMFTNKG